jgi:RNA polymerase sigma-70 factor (ECF subfamily)
MGVILPLQRSTEEPDAGLVAHARDGELWATEALFRRHIKRVLVLAHQLMPEEDSEDIAQETFLRAFAGLHQLQNGAAFGAWLTQVTVSLIKMKLRRKKWMRRLGFDRQEELDAETLVVADAPEAVRVELHDVYLAAQRLPEEPRIALILQRVEGLDLAEIADHMGLSIATVKRRVAQAEKMLEEVKS